MQNIEWRIVEFADAAKKVVMVEYKCGEHSMRLGIRVGDATRETVSEIVDRFAPIQAFQDMLASPSETADELLGMEGVVDVAAREAALQPPPVVPEESPEEGGEPPIGIGEG